MSVDRDSQPRVYRDGSYVFETSNQETPPRPERVLQPTRIKQSTQTYSMFLLVLNKSTVLGFPCIISNDKFESNGNETSHFLGRKERSILLITQTIAIEFTLMLTPTTQTWIFLACSRDFGMLQV